ncbi:Uncharacterized peptidase SA1530 [Anaerobiospirillum thomasii]|uniref:Uncharacterized peptidase SA1530 n=1 Tax=Anaerobiospirillum thomasii TaxID=179995 RepID=A0A2X0VX87_9GAMM|nr:aminopeptidase P family protein [Anaerobiospirillum thomasii]SPT69207.1 Uncharacterized peptidase SA1530 [Anaerobiospirillum thomasii]SPT72240.1 Uncharacterized peptidase SA1530 [Anaerobiospirillum thomasii]
MTEQIETDNYAERLSLLIDSMHQKKLDALILNHDDEYLSHDLTDDCQRIAYLTGFTGSAGIVCIVNTQKDSNIVKEPITLKNLQDNDITIQGKAAVFVDGRYQVQVTKQVDTQIYDTINIKELDIATYLGAILPKNAIVGIDTNCINYKSFLKIQKSLNEHDLTLAKINGNLVDLIWEDRPQRVISKVQIYPDEYNGMPSLHKRQNLAREIRRLGLDATIITSPESICWLLNIRGRDRKNLPVINCRLVAYSNEALEWYIDEDHLDDNIQGELENHFGHVDIFPESRFDDVLERLCSSSCTVYIDPASTTAHMMLKLLEGGANVVEGLGLCELPKACKNPIEIAGEHKAHIKDGIAMCRFLAWLDEITALDNHIDIESYKRRVGDINEEELSDRAEGFRKVEGDYLEPSFDTISAIGANGAMCHYNHAEASEIKYLGDDATYLIDSGAHYLEGTTDITRTVQVGPEVSDEFKQMYTTVLKCHIALSTTIFPKGTSGLQLDAIARRPLWDLGLDYDHGTGHGVGHLLCVHEGPQVISSKQSTVPLEAGMVVSIEPGFYKEGEYGIRLENLVAVEQCNIPGFTDMLCFAPLTLVPFDSRLIVREMLMAKEREWLNNYHQRVYTMIKTAGTTMSDIEITWLSEACKAI